MAQPVDYQGGKPVYNQATPGVGGAIKDAVDAAARAMAPKSVTEIRQREQQAEDDSIGRMRSAQSTDRDNSYSY